MHLIMPGLFGLVFLALLAWLAWISVQSLLQARILFRPLGLGDLKDRLERAVAVRGRADPVGEPGSLLGGSVIWSKTVEQHYHRGGKNSGWRTDSTAEDARPFAVEFHGGGRVLVRGKPSEVHGEDTRTVSRGSNLRTVYSWLPVGADLTVLGKLTLAEDGATLVPHGKTGLLFSTREPGKQAVRELVKGAAGLLAAVFAFLLALLLALTADWG